MVSSQAPPVYGGAGTQALGLGRAMARLGVTVDLLTQNQLQAGRNEWVDGVTILRGPGESLARTVPARAGEVVRTIAFMSWLTTRLLFARYDVIHLHGSFWFGVPAAFVARLLKRPLVVKVTRLDEDDAVTVSQKRLGRVPLGWLYRQPFQQASVTIALSRAIAERQRAVFPDHPLLLQPNGVDVRRFQRGRNAREDERRKLGLPDDAFVVLFVGYLAPHKGVDVLLDAWRRFSPGRDASLLLVGPSAGFYRELRDDVTARAREIESVRVLDHVSFDEMPGIYGAADAFVLPTQAEGMPNSLLEALAAGLPAIVSDVPGVSDIADRATGVHTLREVTAHEIEALLRLLASDLQPGDRESKLPQEFELDYVAAVYVALYDRLLAERQAAMNDRSDRGAA